MTVLHERDCQKYYPWRLAEAVVDSIASGMSKSYWGLEMLRGFPEGAS